MMTLRKNQHFQIPIRPGNSGEKSHPVDSTEIPLLLLLLQWAQYFASRTGWLDTYKKI